MCANHITRSEQHFIFNLILASYFIDRKFAINDLNDLNLEWTIVIFELDNVIAQFRK